MTVGPSHHGLCLRVVEWCQLCECHFLQGTCLCEGCVVPITNAPWDKILSRCVEAVVQKALEPVRDWRQYRAWMVPPSMGFWCFKAVNVECSNSCNGPSINPRHYNLRRPNQQAQGQWDIAGCKFSWHSPCQAKQVDIEEPWSWQVWHFALVLMVSFLLMFFVSKHFKTCRIDMLWFRRDTTSFTFLAWVVGWEDLRIFDCHLSCHVCDVCGLSPLCKLDQWELTCKLVEPHDSFVTKVFTLRLEMYKTLANVSIPKSRFNSIL